MSLPSRPYTSSPLRPGFRARDLPKTFGILLCVSAVALFGCKNDRRSLSGMTGTGLPGGGDPTDPCATRQAGCACDTEGEQIDCGTVKEKTGDYVTCLLGSRVCASGVWSECAADHEDKRPAVYHAPMQGGLSIEGLGSAASCMNLCDPECDEIADTPDGLVVGSGLTATATGLTLAAGSGSGTCDVLDVTPDTTTVVVSAIAANGAVTATPAIVDHDGQCANGVTVQPSWTLDAYDRAVIDTAGKLQVYSGIAGLITVTGTTGTSTDTATVTVKVTVADRGTNPTAATDLDGAGSGADSGKILYPYDNTVFPLDLEAPLVQWDRGPSSSVNNATEVQVALRYPASCTGPTAAVPTSTCTFWYSKIYTGDPTCSPVLTSDGYTATSQCLNNSATTPAWQIPQAVWSAFDRTVKNAAGGGEIVIQRRYGGSAKQEMKVAVKFASESLKGTAYYTQYKRYLKSSSCPTAGSTNGRITSSYEPGNICPVGSCIQSITKGDSTTRDIDLTVTTPTNNNPFVDSSGTNTAGCPVCHSIAANGSRHVSVSQSSQTTGGGTSQGVNDITIVNGLARFSPVATAPNYAVPTGSSDNSYGFAYNAIFPDGSRVLQGPNYWGSTQNTPSSNTVQAPNEVGTTGKLKPYFTVSTGTGGAGVEYATTAPLSPGFTASGGTLTATSNASLTIDGVSVSSGDAVLVKNETGANQKYNGVFTVSNAGSGSAKWVLARRSDMDAASAAEVAVETEVRVTDGDVNRGRVFYISAFAGTINSSNIVFSERLNTTHFGSAAAVTVDYATTSFLTPSPATLTGSVLAGAYPGPLVVDGHTMASMERLLVKDQANPVHNGIYTLTQAGSGGTGAPVTVDYATAAALPTYTGTGTLTASAYGSLTVDGTILAATDRVLVKNEGTGTPPRSARNGIYYVSQVGSTPSPSASTPTGGGVKCATTANLSANYSAGVLTATANGAFGSAAGADACPSAALTDRILVKNQTSTQLNGIYTVTQVGSGWQPWKLTRAVDANAVGELTPLMQVSVTSGTANAGKTFYITTPATGSITPGSTMTGTAMSFSQANKWVLVRAADTMSVGLQILVSSGSVNANAYFYMSYPATAVTLETTQMDFSAATGWQLTRTSDTFAAGEEFDVLNGANNAGRGFHVSSPTTGAVTLGTTSMSFSPNGLPSMMVPVFSPDGSKVAYINGDADLQGGVGETGWRRGLSMFEFAWDSGSSTYAATAKTRLYSTYSSSSAGMVVKWPFFESDSRSLLYVESATDEYCSSSSLTASPTTDAIRACYQGSLSVLGSRGEMTPTNRGYKPGRIYSIDTQNPGSTRVELAKLNDADGSTADADHAYQPTVLPYSSGGYRWAVFTSTRAFGNQINARSYATASYGTATHFTCAAPMLWISALTDSTAGNTDRSNPPFRLPGQYAAKLSSASADYMNERGYLVPAPCKSTGASCTTNDDCCGSDAMPDATAACRAPSGWSPSSGPPAKTCQALSGTCANTGESCAVSGDCCSGTCVSYTCSNPPSLGEATFTREYVAECPAGYKPRWLFFEYHLTTDSDSSVRFEAQSSSDLGTLDAAKVVDLGTSTSTAVDPDAAESIDLSAELIAEEVSNSLQYLRINMTLVPSLDLATAPILHDWDTTYTCEPAE